MRWTRQVRWTRFFWYFVCDTLCIHVYFHALYYIHVMVRLMRHVCSLHCFICHVTWLCSLALLPCFTPIQMSFISYTHAYFTYCVHHVGLGHISMSNSFALIVKSLYEPSILKTSSLLHTRGCIVINHQKGED